MDHLQIKTKIHTIRNQRVILDSDLAEMYTIETKRLKEAVRRNMERFEGDDFMFKLTKNEIVELSRTQIATLNNGRGQNIKYAPFAFTELGVAMLSSVLNSKTAIEINRGIMRTFVFLRQSLSTQPALEIEKVKDEIAKLKEYINEVFTDYNDINEDTRIQIELINTALAELQSTNKTDKNPRRAIGFHTERNSH